MAKTSKKPKKPLIDWRVDERADGVWVIVCGLPFHTTHQQTLTLVKRYLVRSLQERTKRDKVLEKLRTRYKHLSLRLS